MADAVREAAELDARHAAYDAWVERVRAESARNTELAIWTAAWIAGRDWAREQAETDRAASEEADADIADRLDNARRWGRSQV